VVVTPSKIIPKEKYNELRSNIQAFRNLLNEIENPLTDRDSLPSEGTALPPPPMSLKIFDFFLPQDEKLLVSCQLEYVCFIL